MQITKQTKPKDAGQTLLSDTEQRKIYFSFSVPQKISGLQMKHEDLTSRSDSRDYPVHEFRLGAAPPARLERKSLLVLRSCRHVCLPVPPPALPLCVLLWGVLFQLLICRSLKSRGINGETQQLYSPSSTSCSLNSTAGFLLFTERASLFFLHFFFSSCFQREKIDISFQPKIFLPYPRKTL